MEKIKFYASGLNKGKFRISLFRGRHRLSKEEIERYEEQECKILRHHAVSNNNVVACATITDS